MRKTLLAASIALSFSGTTAWASDPAGINAPGISNAGQTATNSSAGTINQAQIAQENSSNGTMTNTGTALNGVQANDNSQAAQMLGSLGLANFGNLGSFNTRVVASQNLSSTVTGNNIGQIGNVAIAASVGGFGGQGGQGGNGTGGAAIGANIALSNATGGNTTNTGGTAVGPASSSGNGAVTVAPTSGQANGNDGGLLNGSAIGVAAGIGGPGGNANNGPGGAGGAGTAATGETTSAGLVQNVKQGNGADQQSTNNTGQIGGNAKGDSGDAKAKADGGSLKVIAGEGTGAKGGRGGSGGEAGSAKANAGFFNAGNWIDSAFSNGAGIVQSVQNSGIAASVVQAVNIQANIGAGR